MMQFEKIKSTLYQARGKNGIFQTRKSNGAWWSTYIGVEKCFRLPPRHTVKEAKQLCMENNYWEDR